MAIGARIEPGIPHVPGIGITPDLGVSDILLDPLFMPIIAEFSIEQGSVFT